MLARFFADVKCDRAQAVKASLLSNSALATSVHPLNGQTTLQVAVQSAGESVIRALRRHGARWTDPDPQGNNAVHYVAQVARVDLCRYRKSADWVMALHAPNAAGDTPLHTSMALPDIPEVTEIIQAFVAVGADISRPNSEGKSALDLAEDRPELYQLMQDTAHACRSKPSAMTQPESMSQMGGGASLIGGGPSVLGSGPSSIGGGHGSFIGGPGIHAYQNFPPHRNGPQSSDPAYGAPLSPLRAGSGVASESRMATDVSPSAKASVAFGRSARTRSTSTPGTVPGAVQGTPNRSPHSVRRSGREDGTPPGMSRSPQRRSRTPVSRYSPPTSLRAIRTSAEQPTAMPPVADNTTTAAAAAAAAAQRARRASASDITRTDRADSIGALKSPSGMTPHGLTQQAMTPPASRTNVGDPPAAKPTAAATVNLSPLEKKVAEVQVALRHAKGALSEIQSAREVDQKQMGTFSKSISLVSERLDGIDSAVRTVASATAEAAEAAAAGRKEGVAELREMKGHVESLWRDVAGGKAWQKDADEQLQGLQAELRRASEVADSAEATAEAARAAAAAAAEAADEAAADVARLRDSAAAPHPAERDLHAAAQADAAAAMESATADAAAKAADAAAAAGAAEAVAAVSQELAELRASVTEVRAFRGPAFDTIREDVDELREFHATAKLKFVELDDALERLEEATAADTGVVVRQSAARSLEPSPDQWVGSVVPDEVADRLDDVCRKVGALESQVAVWSKAHGADGEAAHGGSGTSASPPRTPEAYSSYPEDASLDITCDLMVGPQAAPHTGASHREVTASKAGIYTNVYSGPTATLEFSMLAERLDSMGLVVDEVSKAVKTLRADVDSLKTAKARGSTPFSDAGGQGSFGQMFGSDDPERGPGLGDLREYQMRSDAGRFEADEAVAELEGRMERLDHAVKLVQHTAAQHEDRIASLMYSPGQARPADATAAGLKNTVEQLEARLMSIEVQYAGRLQAQKAKADQQASLITALMERVAALEARCP